MGSYSQYLTIWLLLIMTGATFTVASQAHRTDTNDYCLTEQRYNDTFLEIKKDFSDLKEFVAGQSKLLATLDIMKEELGQMKENQAHLEKIILTMADSLSALTTRVTPLCENTATPEDFYAAARDGNIDYITSSVCKCRVSNSTLHKLFTWHNGNDNNRTALHVAAAEGHEQVVLALLEAGANPNAEDGRDHVPMTLLEAGASHPVENRGGNTPVHLAAEYGHVAVLRALLQPQFQADVNYPSNGDDTPIHYAALGGHTEALNVLIARGADVNSLDNGGWTPIMVASAWGRVSTVDALFDSWQNVTLGDADPEGLTALHLAARGNHSGVVRLLLQNGADKGQQDNNGRTPADLAIQGGHDKLADIINNVQQKQQIHY